jgi:hypothetical protein
VPRRRGLRPRLIAAVVRSRVRSAFTAERQDVRRTGAMSCVLRIGGVQLDVEALLHRVALSAYRVDRKGSPRRLRNRGVFEESTIHGDVSDADFADLAKQVADAIRFLEANAEAVRAAVRFPGVGRATLDFAIASKDVAIDSSYLPPDLLRIAGELGVGIELSTYPPAAVNDV